MSQDYSAADLSVLEDLEAVRERPAMYIDHTDQKGIHKIFDEIFDNAVDEYLAGHCSEIYVEIDPEGYPEGSVSIKDNGRGMPVDKVLLVLILSSLNFMVVVSFPIKLIMYQVDYTV